MRGQSNGYSPDDISADEHAAIAALGGLFLDRELGPDELSQITHTLIALECSADEARHLLETIVAPAFVANLTQVAGCWSAWSSAEVEQIVTAFLARGRWKRMFMLWRARRLRGLYEADWRSIARELDRHSTSITKQQG